jgi:hypothetical protein
MFSKALRELRGRKLGPAGQEYATVWRIRIPFTNLSLRLHHWYGHDDPRAFHSHPQWFWLVVLWGGYTDVSLRDQPHAREAVEREVNHYEDLAVGSIRFRPADYKHTVQHVRPNTWTLLLFGGTSQRWDFWDRETRRRYKRDKWFAEHGHHTQDGSAPIRMRPDGSLI